MNSFDTEKFKVGLYNRIIILEIKSNISLKLISLLIFREIILTYNSQRQVSTLGTYSKGT